MTALIDLISPPRSDSPAVRLRIHIHRRPQGGWCADIDDEQDRQPADPYWFIGDCRDVAEAVTAACAELAVMAADPVAVAAHGRLSGWIDPVLAQNAAPAGRIGVPQ